MLGEMASLDQPADGSHGRSGAGRRVLVLWLCWVVLAAFLIAAGMVAFDAVAFG